MDGLLILAIETATGCGSVALTIGDVRDGRLLAECTSQPDVTHSRRLLGSVEWLMDVGGVKWTDLDGIAISLGPGSFTGLRIGMAAAKGIAMATGAPFIGVPTLDGLALSCMGAEGQVCCVLDARKQEVYAAFYSKGQDGFFQPIGTVAAIRPEDLLEQISEPTLMAGPATTIYRDIFAENTQVRIHPAALSAPRAANVGLLAAGQLRLGETMEPATAAPMYVRASEAEINLRRQVTEDRGQKSEARGQKAGVGKKAAGKVT